MRLLAEAMAAADQEAELIWLWSLAALGAAFGIFLLLRA